jgi:polar amino acid transport system substrate-binding protein
MGHLSRILGVEFTYEYGTVASFLPSLQAKRVELAFAGFGTTQERQKVADFVPYSEVGYAFIGKKDGKPVNTLDDLCGTRIAVSLGTTTATYAETQSKKCADAGKPTINLQTYKGANENVLAVRSGRADYYWAPESTAIAVTGADKQMRIAGHDTVNPPSSIGISFLKGSDLVPAFKAAVEEFISTDEAEYKAIIKKYNLSEGTAITKVVVNPPN